MLGVHDQSWAQWVAEALVLPLTNLAVDGARAPEVLREQVPMLERPYDLGTLHVGVNDARDPAWDPDRFGEAFEGVLAALAAACEAVLVLHAPARPRSADRGAQAGRGERDRAGGGRARRRAGWSRSTTWPGRSGSCRTRCTRPRRGRPRSRGGRWRSAACRGAGPHRPSPTPTRRRAGAGAGAGSSSSSRTGRGAGPRRAGADYASLHAPPAPPRRPRAHPRAPARRAGRTAGPRCRFLLLGGGTVVFGEGCVVGDRARFDVVGGQVVVGRGARIGSGFIVVAHERVEIVPA